MSLWILCILFVAVWEHSALAVRSRVHRGEVRGPSLLGQAKSNYLSDKERTVRGLSRNDATCTYMVEYRGHYRDFRELEFFDNLEYALSSVDPDHSVKEDIRRILDSRRLVIPDKTGVDFPLCVYIDTDAHMDVVALAASRCSMLRSLSVRWGEGPTPESANEVCMGNFESVIAPTYYNNEGNTGNCSHDDKVNNWRVSFRRYGRSAGWNTEEKIELLSKFNPTLKALGGNVDLKGAAHDLIYLEDWHNFHQEVTLKEQQRAKSREAGTTLWEGEEEEREIAQRERDKNDYVPLKSIIGEIIAEPLPVESLFDLRRRPFLGTTSMCAVSSHLASVAANAGLGRRVLDPFCGTGSLLLSSAYLGADVVGSDIDATTVGLGLDDDESTRPGAVKANSNVTRFKNQNFRRYGAMQDFDQSTKSTIDNFHFYGLQERVSMLAGCDVQSWLNAFLNPYVAQLRPVYGEEQLIALPITPFDAICCDPPYSRREKASGNEGAGDAPHTLKDARELAAAVPYATSSFMGDPRKVLSTLLQLARVGIKPGGRLVFWFPSEAFLSEDTVKKQLEGIELIAQEELHQQQQQQQVDKRDFPQLSLLRVTAEKMHDKLWRWLVVYEVGGR